MPPSRINRIQKENGNLHMLFVCMSLVLVSLISIGIGYGLYPYTPRGWLETSPQNPKASKNEILTGDRGPRRGPVLRYKIPPKKMKQVLHESSELRKNQDLKISNKDITNHTFKQRQKRQPSGILRAESSLNTVNRTQFINTPTSLNQASQSPNWIDPTKEKRETSSNVIRIKAIKFKKEKNQSETVLLYADRFFEPKVFGLDGINPYGTSLRLVVDIRDASYIHEKNSRVNIKGRIIKQIRFHHDDNNKLRMVIDLESAEGYRVDQVFYSKENIYCLNISLKKEMDSEKM